jgi:hypothetical protein
MTRARHDYVLHVNYFRYQFFSLGDFLSRVSSLYCIFKRRFWIIIKIALLIWRNHKHIRPTFLHAFWLPQIYYLSYRLFWDFGPSNNVNRRVCVSQGWSGRNLLFFFWAQPFEHLFLALYREWRSKISESVSVLSIVNMLLFRVNCLLLFRLKNWRCFQSRGKACFWTVAIRRHIITAHRDYTIFFINRDFNLQLSCYHSVFSPACGSNNRT